LKAKSEFLKEFRLVTYMNAPDSRGFYGGRGAASPLAYYCQLNKSKKSKVFLGGSIILKGLGKYHSYVSDALKAGSKPVTLPKRVWCGGEHILISDKAFIYQNDDPLLRSSEKGIYWTAKIDRLGLDKTFSEEEQERFTLDAVRIGREEYAGEPNEKTGWRVLASRLQKLTHALHENNSPRLMVYRGNGVQGFWGHNGMPVIRRRNAFVHMSTEEWAKHDESAETKEVNCRELIDSQIKNTHINESLVHEMLRIMFGKEGWWVNYELPVRDGRGEAGRIDFLIKRHRADVWRLIEVKLRDNPDAVAQLRWYKRAIRHDVCSREDDSLFWLLWNGRGCKEIKGVIICAPGDCTLEKALNAGYDLWTYRYFVKDSQLGMELRDAVSKEVILATN